jgi:hypothetical protein
MLLISPFLPPVIFHEYLIFDYISKPNIGTALSFSVDLQMVKIIPILLIAK